MKNKTFSFVNKNKNINPNNVSNTKAKLDKLEQEYDEFMKALIDSINENHDAFKSTQQHNINSQGD